MSETSNLLRTSQNDPMSTIEGAWNDEPMNRTLITIMPNGQMHGSWLAAPRIDFSGTFIGNNTWTVNFPDDRVYTGVVTGNQIYWGPNNTWRRSTINLRDEEVLQGAWTDNHGDRSTIHEHGAAFTGAWDMERPEFHGVQISSGRWRVTFPYDGVYDMTLNHRGIISWDVGRQWTKGAVTNRRFENHWDPDSDEGYHEDE